MLRTFTIALMFLTAATVRAQEEAPVIAAMARDNIVILLDASGSMEDDMPGSGESKMSVAKQALSRVVDQIDPNANVGLLVFSDNPNANGWLYDLSPLDRSRLQGAIDRVDAVGGTPLGEYLKIAADKLLEARQGQRGYGTYRLLVVTDGEANDPELLGRYLPDVLARGVRIDCIGVAMAQDHALATRVQSYRRADDPAALEAAVAAVLGEVGAGNASDDVDVEQFELASAIPEEMAVAVLDSLTTPVNVPIGEGTASEEPLEMTLGDGQPYFGGRNSGGGLGSFLGGACFCFGIFIVLILAGAGSIAKAAKRRR